MQYGFIYNREIYIIEAESSLAVKSYIASLKVQDLPVKYLGQLNNFYIACLYQIDINHNEVKPVVFDNPLHYLYGTFKDKNNKDHYIYLTLNYSISTLNNWKVLKCHYKHDIDAYNGPTKYSKELSSLLSFDKLYSPYQVYVTQKIKFEELENVNLFNQYTDIMDKKAVKYLLNRLNKGLEETVQTYNSLINYIKEEYCHEC